MSYEWLIFDADGTLFDYDRAEQHALAMAFEEFGLPFEQRHLEAYQEINGQLWRAFEKGTVDAATIKVERFRMLLATTGTQVQAEMFSNRYLTNLSTCTYLIPGAERIVRHLGSRHGLLLLTNGLTEVQRPRIAASALAGCFDHIVISEEVGVSKPDPRIFDIAFSVMASPPKHNVLIIGDSLTSDMRGGNIYGIDTCWYNPQQRLSSGMTCTYEVTRLDELIDLLDT